MIHTPPPPQVKFKTNFWNITQASDVHAKIQNNPLFSVRQDLNNKIKKQLVPPHPPNFQKRGGGGKLVACNQVAHFVAGQEFDLVAKVCDIGLKFQTFFHSITSHESSTFYTNEASNEMLRFCIFNNLALIKQLCLGLDHIISIYIQNPSIHSYHAKYLGMRTCITTSLTFSCESKMKEGMLQI